MFLFEIFDFMINYKDLKNNCWHVFPDIIYTRGNLLNFVYHDYLKENYL